ncbi:hypothetical protein [Limnohabitans sp. Rim11]|jgi:hypothetical protein|uniref:hypothetical protein n=1 Tax=Limnohabitans sp. Rim11 TaxID=1100719 RepID=UPI000AD4FBC8|nr:hypothetical protein [Limnohabitans sp. Rim11]
MFIPAQTPDLHLPLTQLLEAKPVTPVTAVPGIPEDAQHLDSRVALQWTQPVLQGDPSHASRNSLAATSNPEPVKVLALTGFEPQGPDPDALRKGEVHPLMTRGLASWLAFVLSKPARIQRITPDAAPSPSDDVMPALLSIYQQIASSDMFAAQRLSEAWLPNKQKTQVHDSVGLLKEFKAIAQPTSENTTVQLSKWVAALEPDNDNAQQAAHMLTQGQMMWQADLAPGITMRMVREDAWRNAANKPAQLEKGALLKVEVELPNLGRIRITGSQWGEDLSLQIAHASEAQGHWTNHVPSLLQDLKASGISDVRLETFPNDSEVPNG